MLLAAVVGGLLAWVPIRVTVRELMKSNDATRLEAQHATRNSQAAIRALQEIREEMAELRRDGCARICATEGDGGQ